MFVHISVCLSVLGESRHIDTNTHSATRVQTILHILYFSATTLAVSCCLTELGRRGGIAGSTAQVAAAASTSRYSKSSISKRRGSSRSRSTLDQLSFES